MHAAKPLIYRLAIADLFLLVIVLFNHVSVATDDVNPEIIKGSEISKTRKWTRDTSSSPLPPTTSQQRRPRPGAGVLDPHDISNVGFFVLFALLGLGLVIGAIWFFFWARNGGFQFKETDWEDYKTAVLRRRGPNGTTLLSGATASTKLGGGSVYKDVADDDDDEKTRQMEEGRTVVTESTGMSGWTAGASDVAARERREEKRAQRKKERERRRKEKGTNGNEGGEGKKRRRVNGDGGVQDEAAEQKALDELRSYRHEKPARVGGLNKEAEGSTWDGSNATVTGTTLSSEQMGTDETELLSNDRQRTPTSKSRREGGEKSKGKDKKRGGVVVGGIRKVYSMTASAEREAEGGGRPPLSRDQSQGQGRARQKRRDFSFEQSGTGLTDSLLPSSPGKVAARESSGRRSEVSSVPAPTGSSNNRGEGSDLGTKSYHHPRPEITRVQREREREERRARRGGYRRGRRDDDELD